MSSWTAFSSLPFLNLILAENGQKNYKFNINFRFVTIEEFTWLFLEQIYSRQEQSEVKKALTVIISENHL